MDELRERQTHTANHLLKLNSYRLGSNKLCEAQPRRGGRGAPTNSSSLNLISVSNLPSGNYSESNASTNSITSKDQNTIKKGRFKVKRVASGAQEDGILK